MLHCVFVLAALMICFWQKLDLIIYLLSTWSLTVHNSRTRELHALCPNSIVFLP